LLMVIIVHACNGVVIEEAAKRSWKSNQIIPNHTLNRLHWILTENIGVIKYKGLSAFASMSHHPPSDPSEARPGQGKRNRAIGEEMHADY
jgi:hypothetical protein